MKRPLLDVVFASDKRKGVLLLLQDGAKKTDFLLKSIDTTRQALLPQVKVLEEHYLVDHYDDTFELTTTGKVLVDDMKRLIDKTKIFDVDIEYWGTRNLDFIPPYLMKRITELEKCTVIRPKLPEMYTLPPQIYGASSQFQEDSRKSKSFTGVGTFFYPNYYEVFSRMINNHVKLSLVITQDLFDKIKSPEHARIVELLKGERFHLYVYPGKIDFVSFAYDDYCLLMRLLNTGGDYDNSYVVCSSPSALQWGKELYEYYLKESIPVSEDSL